MSFLTSVRRWLGLAQSAVPDKSPDPEFMGEALAYNLLFNRFGLTKDDLSTLTEDLPPDLKEPTKFWIVIYDCWLFRIALREKYGQSFMEAALVAARRRLERKVEGFDGRPVVDTLEFWFTKLDDATSSLGLKFKGHELPFEVLAAWSFLALDGESPFVGRTEVPNQLDLSVADCLEKGKAAALGIIRFTVELGRPLPADPNEVATISRAALAEIAQSERELTWSLDLGPEERHLRRRLGNPLFPKQLRVITQDDIKAARERDRVGLNDLRTDVQRTLEKVFSLLRRAARPCRRHSARA